MTEYSLKLKYELFELFLCKLKSAFLLVAKDRKADKDIFWYNFDVSLHLKGVKVLAEFRLLLLNYLAVQELMVDFRSNDEYEIRG